MRTTDVSTTDVLTRPGQGEAGRADDAARSDLFVSIEEATSGGLALELASKVELYYGDAIREQVSAVLAGLGVEHARVTIQDRGALPFCIAARVEAAARRAGLVVNGAGERAAVRVERAPSARDRLRRSRLYVPGNEPKYMLNAGLYGADAVILDLEDSVHESEKDAARVLVRNALHDLEFGTSERMVRINQLPLGLDDLEFLLPARPDLILIPKVESPEEMHEVDRRIDAVHARVGSRAVRLMPIIESALGVERAHDIACASERIVALTLGLEDLTADLGVAKTFEGDETLYARMRVVNAARAAGLQAIDSVFGDLADLKGLESWGRRSRALGFEGMGCIHPRQIPVIHRAYAPGAAEIEKALRIVAAFEDAQQRGLGVVSLGAKMIDPPVVQRALTLVERARAMGLVADPTSSGDS